MKRIFNRFFLLYFPGLFIRHSSYLLFQGRGGGLLHMLLQRALLFLPNGPGNTFIQGAKSIPDSRIVRIHRKLLLFFGIQIQTGYKKSQIWHFPDCIFCILFFKDILRLEFILLWIFLELLTKMVCKFQDFIGVHTDPAFILALKRGHQRTFYSEWCGWYQIRLKTMTLD